MKKNNSIIKRNEPLLVIYVIYVLAILAIIIILCGYDSCTGGDEIYNSPAITEEMFVETPIHRNII